MIKLLVLLFLLAFKHFICDYVFQLDGSSGLKRRPGWRGISALIEHANYHGFMTLVIVGLYLTVTTPLPLDLQATIYVFSTSIVLGLIDFASHFGIDFAKIRLEKYLAERWFHTDFLALLILDQLLHTGVYLGFIYFLLV